MLYHVNSHLHACTILAHTDCTQQEIAVVGTGGMTASSFTKPAPPGQHPIGQGQPLPNNGRTDTAKLDRTAAKVSVLLLTTTSCTAVYSVMKLHTVSRWMSAALGRSRMQSCHDALLIRHSCTLHHRHCYC
jgi:hypothetical protein